MPIKANDTVGGWRVVRFVGAGRCGAVYEVVEAHGNRRGAMKVFSLKADSFGRECDVGEERPVGDGMPAFYGSGRLADGTPYLVTELLERLPTDSETGEPQPLGKREIVAFFRALCETVIRLHADGRGYIHCDIKPENILLRGKRPVLADFGTARRFGEASRTERRVGSWEYMAPETRDGLRIDARADVYSLGVLLGKLCSRKTRRVFEELVVRATSNQPEDRPQTVADFPRELKAGKDRLAKFHVVIRATAAILFGITATVLCGRLYQQFSATAETAALRHAEAETEVGVKCYQNRDFTNAVEHLERAVQTLGYANPEAYGMLADCYRRGRGTKKDIEKSRRYATFAAERGDERGKKVLSRLAEAPSAADK